MITREEADQIAEKWLSESAPAGASQIPMVQEFDLGYVVWGKRPPGEPPLIGANRGVIDKDTGELSVWPSLPVCVLLTPPSVRVVSRVRVSPSRCVTVALALPSPRSTTRLRALPLGPVVVDETWPFSRSTVRVALLPPGPVTVVSRAIAAEPTVRASAASRVVDNGVRIFMGLSSGEGGGRRRSILNAPAVRALAAPGHPM